jgi:flagellar biosynthesis protein FlhB
MMGAAAAAVTLHAGRLAAMPAMPLRDGVQAAGAIVLDAVLAALASGAAFAVVDVMIARWRWARAARMTVAEAREERRLEDGDPSLRARRRAAGRTMIAGSARRRDQRAEAA